MLEVSLLIVGAIFAINAIFGGVVQIYAGHLGDRYGFRRIILIFASGYFFTMFSLFSSAIFFPIPLIFILLFIANQVMASLFMPSLNALLSLSSDIPLSGFSFMRIASNLGWAFGPALGGIIISAYGYPYIYLVAAGATLISVPLFFLLVDKKNVESVPEKFTFRNLERGLYSFGISTAFLFVVVSQFSVTLSIYANHIVGLGTSSIGLIYFVNGISVAAFQFPIYLLVRRIGMWNGMVLGSILYVIGYFSISLDHPLWQFMLSMFVVTMGENAVTPTGNAMVSRIAGGRKLGTHMGVYNFFNSLGRGLGPSYGTFLLSYLIDPYLIWGFAVLPALVSIPAFLSLKSREERSAIGISSSPQK